jgi:hypothetical protein
MSKPEEQKKQLSGLEKELDEKNVNYAVFRTTTEEQRKRFLGDDYENIRLKYQWNYDQQIPTEEEKKAAAEEKEREEAAAKEYKSNSTTSKTFKK